MTAMNRRSGVRPLRAEHGAENRMASLRIVLPEVGNRVGRHHVASTADADIVSVGPAWHGRSDRPRVKHRAGFIFDLPTRIGRLDHTAPHVTALALHPICRGETLITRMAGSDH